MVFCFDQILDEFLWTIIFFLPPINRDCEVVVMYYDASKKKTGIILKAQYHVANSVVKSIDVSIHIDSQYSNIFKLWYLKLTTVFLLFSATS